ncbi:hypothetical protein DS832_05375 [Bombilactobacillus bombi]|uniref:Uncharacterized protein n=1 Tax=Bombilactobacillus bombi TaxID=1303590 RepID=A0A417Z8D4_9LACO|nr:hypothetical protein [Bombilactobacillus bombi]RHW46917.1 hypothetical protein DS832_05375 [Bombilactobacillus bombi]
MANTHIQKLLKQAQQLLAKKQYLAAADLYEQIYLQEPTFEMERQWVQALHLAHHNQKILTVLKNSWLQYLNKPADTKLLLEGLIAKHDFIAAYQVLLQINWHNPPQKVKLRQLINTRQLAFARTNVKYQHELQNQVLSVLTLSLDEQVDLIAQLHQLSLQEFLRMSKLLLTNPYLHPLIKAGVTEDLVKLKISTKMEINFYGKISHFEPQRYPLIADLNAVKNMQALLTNYQHLSEDNRQAISGELNLYAAMLYPYTDDIILEPQLWIDLTLQHFGFEKTVQTLEKDAKAGKVDMWLSKLGELLSLFN